MKRAIILTLLASLAAVGSAQSISSFTSVTDLTDVNTSITGPNLNLNVGANPTFKIGTTTYQIERVWGVWALDDNDDMGGATADQGNWKSNTNFASFGGILGWKTQNPNQGLLANQSVGLTFSSLTGTRQGIGYHVRVIGTVPGGGNTLHIRNVAAVPEPATMATLGLGAMALIRGRRRNRS